MKNATLLGISLLFAGALMLGYGHFNYTTEEKILEVGPIKATTERTKTVPLPPVIAWTLIGSGACIVVFSALNRKL